MRLILLRHGQTGLSGRYFGSTDVSLSGEGCRQMRSLGSDLAALGIDSVLASPMRRCVQSAELLGLGLPVQFDPDLREIDFGRWEGKSFAEIEAQDPERVREWAQGNRGFSFPDGETISGFISRVESVKERLLAAAAENMLVVSHGGVIRALICALLGLSWENYLLFQVAKGHYSTIELFGDGGGVLTGFNLGGKG